MVGWTVGEWVHWKSSARNVTHLSAIHYSGLRLLDLGVPVGSRLRSWV